MTGSTLVFVTRGPQAGVFLEMTDADAAAAEAEGWGENAIGRDAYSFSAPLKGPHEKAQAWLDKQAPSGRYMDRALRPAPPGSRPAAASDAAGPLLDVGKPDEEGEADEGKKTKDAESKKPRASK